MRHHGAIRSAVLLGLCVSLASSASAQRRAPAGNDVVRVPLDRRPYGVTVTPEGAVYVGRVDAGDLSIYELPGTARTATVPMISPAYDVIFLPDAGTAYAVNVPARALSVIDRATGAVVRTIDGLGELFRVRASPEGAFVFATTSTGSLHRISTDDDSVSTLRLPGVLNGLVVNEPRRVLYASSTGGMLYEVDLETFVLRRSTMIGGMPQGMAVSADGQTLFLANEQRGAQVIDAGSLDVTATIAGTNGAFDVAITADGARLYVSSSQHGVLSVVDAARLAVVRTYPGGIPRRMAFSPDGLVLVVANEAGWVTFIR